MKLSPLTPVQFRISSLLAAGNRPQDIARILKASPQSVRRQISSILLKLDLTSSLGISAWYWKNHAK